MAWNYSVEKTGIQQKLPEILRPDVQ